MSLVKRLQEATGKTSLWEILKKAGLSVALDGNWGHSALNLTGTSGVRLVGEDVLGNKYFEDTTRMYGRHRWVVYANTSDYAGSQIPPEWHAWVHYIGDNDPVSQPPVKRKFDIAFQPNPTGTTERYLPKGSWENPEQRNWSKHQYWQPPSA